MDKTSLSNYCQDQILVITPVRNEIGRVKSMISSLRGQRHELWIAVFGDNASTDGTREFLLSQQSLDNRIVVVSYDKGLPIHQNFRRTIEFALKNSTANYVQFLAADDELNGDDYFSICLDQIKRQRCDIVCGSVDAFDGAEKLDSRSFEEAIGKKSSTSKTVFAVLNYWICNLIYGFYTRKAFEESYANPASTFTDNLSSDWWFAQFAYRTFRVGYSMEISYKKFQKSLDYSNTHYSLSNTENTKSTFRKMLFFPFIQLGDRKAKLPLYAQSLYLAGFVWRDFIQLFRSFRAKYLRI